MAAPTIVPNEATQKAYSMVATMNELGSPTKLNPKYVLSKISSGMHSPAPHSVNARIFPTKIRGRDARDIDLQDSLLFASLAIASEANSGANIDMARTKRQDRNIFLLDSPGLYHSLISACTGAVGGASIRRIVGTHNAIGISRHQVPYLNQSHLLRIEPAHSSGALHRVQNGPE